MFDNINELIPYDLKEDWDGFLSKKYNNLPFLNAVRERNVKNVITKTPYAMDCASIDNDFVIRKVDDFVYDEVEPKMVFINTDKKIIAVGAFPAEFWAMNPNLIWYEYDYYKFYEMYKKEDYNLAIIGDCDNDSMKFSFKSTKPVICYKPSVYIDNLTKNPIVPVLTNKSDLYNRIKTASVGAPLGIKGCRYEVFNNKYWIKHEYADLDSITVNNNIVFCNGWVLPQHLIQEGYVEV